MASNSESNKSFDDYQKEKLKKVFEKGYFYFDGKHSERYTEKQKEIDLRMEKEAHIEYVNDIPEEQGDENTPNLIRELRESLRVEDAAGFGGIENAKRLREKKERDFEYEYYDNLATTSMIQFFYWIMNNFLKPRKDNSIIDLSGNLIDDWSDSDDDWSDSDDDDSIETLTVSDLLEYIQLKLNDIPSSHCNATKHSLVVPIGALHQDVAIRTRPADYAIRRSNVHIPDDILTEHFCKILRQDNEIRNEFPYGVISYYDLFNYIIKKLYRRKDLFDDVINAMYSDKWSNAAAASSRWRQHFDDSGNLLKDYKFKYPTQAICVREIITFLVTGLTGKHYNWGNKLNYEVFKRDIIKDIKNTFRDKDKSFKSHILRQFLEVPERCDHFEPPIYSIGTGITYKAMGDIKKLECDHLLPVVFSIVFNVSHERHLYSFLEKKINNFKSDKLPEIYRDISGNLVLDSKFIYDADANSRRYIPSDYTVEPLKSPVDDARTVSNLAGCTTNERFNPIEFLEKGLKPFIDSYYSRMGVPRERGFRPDDRNTVLEYLGRLPEYNRINLNDNFSDRYDVYLCKLFEIFIKILENNIDISNYSISEFLHPLIDNQSIPESDRDASDRYVIDNIMRTALEVVESEGSALDRENEYYKIKERNLEYAKNLKNIFQVSRLKDMVEAVNKICMARFRLINIFMRNNHNYLLLAIKKIKDNYFKGNAAVESLAKNKKFDNTIIQYELNEFLGNMSKKISGISKKKLKIKFIETRVDEIEQTKDYIDIWEHAKKVNNIINELYDPGDISDRWENIGFDLKSKDAQAELKDEWSRERDNSGNRYYYNDKTNEITAIFSRRMIKRYKLQFELNKKNHWVKGNSDNWDFLSIEHSECNNCNELWIMLDLNKEYKEYLKDCDEVISNLHFSRKTRIDSPEIKKLEREFENIKNTHLYLKIKLISFGLDTSGNLMYEYKIDDDKLCDKITKLDNSEVLNQDASMCPDSSKSYYISYNHIVRPCKSCKGDIHAKKIILDKYEFKKNLNDAIKKWEGKKKTSTSKKELDDLIYIRDKDIIPGFIRHGNIYSEKDCKAHTQRFGIKTTASDTQRFKKWIMRASKDIKFFEETFKDDLEIILKKRDEDNRISIEDRKKYAYEMKERRLVDLNKKLQDKILSVGKKNASKEYNKQRMSLSESNSQDRVEKDDSDFSKASSESDSEHDITLDNYPQPMEIDSANYAQAHMDDDDEDIGAAQPPEQQPKSKRPRTEGGKKHTKKRVKKSSKKKLGYKIINTRKQK